MNKLIRCTKIGVDCVENHDCEEPDYLGFDFFVPKDQSKEMKEFIIETLNYFEIPLIRVFNDGVFDLEKDSVWTKKRIVETISRNAEELINEAHISQSR